MMHSLFYLAAAVWAAYVDPIAVAPGEMGELRTWMSTRLDLGQGMVQVFRRPESPYESARFRLGGLDPDAKYVLTDLDTNQPREITGRELLDMGLLVGAAQRPAAVVITYRRMP